jgi:3-oxoacyl-[acyl-carrier protein] reductase
LSIVNLECTMRLMVVMTPLAGRIAFVTGAARGVGRAIALALADAGADIAIADVHPHRFTGEQYYRLRARVSGEDESESTASAVEALGRRAVELQVDVARMDSVAEAVQSCVDRLGAPDILVNNAGIVNNFASITGMDPAAWDHELRVNLSGMFHTVRCIAPPMADRGWGRVINISSVAALTPGFGQPAYAASKAGVIGFTRAVAREFGSRGVTANVVLPGLIATPLVRSMPEHIRDMYARQAPAGRLGEPEEVGSLVAFLATPQSGFINGVVVPVDGGLTGAPVVDTANDATRVLRTADSD